MSVYMCMHIYICIYVCLCEWARDVHRKHDGATVPKFSDWLRRRIVSFADFTASTSFTDWNSEFFADSSLESSNRINYHGCIFFYCCSHCRIESSLCGPKVFHSPYWKARDLIVRCALGCVKTTPSVPPMCHLTWRLKFPPASNES